MSPRAEKFMVQARERAVAAQELFTADHLEPAVSVAYYAMLNAARAALSENDEHRTHRGTWRPFRECYVVTGAFDEKLHALAINAQGARERGDNEAVKPSPAEAKEIVDGADTFVVTVEHMLAA